MPPSSSSRNEPVKGIKHSSSPRTSLGEREDLELQELSTDGTRATRSESHDAKSGAERDNDYEEDDESDEDNAPLAGTGRRRTSSVQSFEMYTPDEERQVRRKLDTRLVLFVALLYMMGFLDRSNIGNARIAGLSKDLHLSDNQFEWLLTAFYISYVAFEWMTLCYKIFPPHIYISCCVCAWGVVASLQSLVSSFGFMIALRALLGIGEAAFVGMPFYLSFFFRREELAFRTGIFISAAPLATSFASGLAWVIVKFGKLIPIADWRLLFLLEGFPACIVAVWAWHWLPDSPGEARWLNSRERKIAVLRMRKETSGTNARPKESANNIPRHEQKFKWNEVAQTLLDPKSYLTAGMFFCCNVAFSSMPVFLPVILRHGGYSTLASEGLSALPMLFAFVIVLLTALLSDRIKSRSIPMVFHALLAMSGYLFLVLAGILQFSPFIRYLAVFPICAGFFSCVTIVITWTVNNQASDEGKGTGMAVLNVIGQMGPLLGTRLYPDADGPYYIKGMSVCAGALGLVAILAVCLRIYLLRLNRKVRRSWSAAEGEGLVGGSGRSEKFIFMT